MLTQEAKALIERTWRKKLEEMDSEIQSYTRSVARQAAAATAFELNAGSAAERKEIDDYLATIPGRVPVVSSMLPILPPSLQGIDLRLIHEHDDPAGRFAGWLNILYQVMVVVRHAAACGIYDDERVVEALKLIQQPFFLSKLGLQVNSNADFDCI